MIDINLIPVNLRKDGGGTSGSLSINLPKDVMLGVGSGLILLMLVVHLLLGAVWLLGTFRLSQYNAAWQKQASDKTVLDAIHKEMGDLKNKIKLTSDITVKKSVPWAPKFNAISDALPRGLWIRKMTLDKTGLSIEGSVVSKTQNEINNVDKFLSVLRADDNFMKGFTSLEVNSIQRSHSNAIEVADFIVMAKLPEIKVDEHKRK